MNKVFLIGRLTRDPELTVVSTGISLCRFSIAISRRFVNADGTRETDYFNCVAWRGLADNCAKFLKKGSQVAVAGSIQTRSYENKEGVKVNVIDIVADDVEFLTSKAEAEVTSGPKDDHVAELQPIQDDDLPF